jgi:hypothetical protein
VETNTLPATTTRVKVAFSTDLEALEIEAAVVRNNPGVGFGLKFDDAVLGSRETVKQILTFVERTVRADADGLRYLVGMHENR